MTALARAELAARIRMVGGLAAGAGLLMALMAWAYASVGVDLLGPSLQQGTPSVYAAFAGTDDVDLLEPLGWMGFGFHHPLFLVLTLCPAIAFGTASVAGEVEAGRAELLVVRPRSRAWFAAAHGLAWAAAEVLVLLGGLAGALLGGALVGDVRDAGLAHLALGPLAAVPLACAFAGVAFLASTACRRRGQALGLAVGAAAAAYLLDVAAAFVEPLSWVRWLGPFAYDDPVGALTDGPSPRDALVLLGLAAVTTAAGLRILERRDLA